MGKQSQKNQKAKKNNKFWNIINNEEDSTAELHLYGDISSSESWWDDVVTPQQFKEDLKSLGNKDEIVVRINSGGGDVFAASTIYSQLKDNSAKIRVKIDGFCASAATIVAMAGDIIEMSPVGMFMIHDPMFGLLGYYNAQELREAADTLDKVKESIMNAYIMRTSKSREELVQMMKDTTWLTADEALEEGFVDEIMFQDSEEDQEEPIFDGTNLIINSVSIDISNFSNIPTKFIKDKKKNYSTSNSLEKSSFFNTNKTNKSSKEEESIMDQNEIKNKYPEVYNAIKNEGVREERQRIKNIDDLGMPGYEEVLNKAKFETGITAEAAAMEIIKAQKQKGTEFLTNREEDVKNSKIKDVEGNKGTGGDKEEKKQEEENAILDSAVSAINRKRGIK